MSILFQISKMALLLDTNSGEKTTFFLPQDGPVDRGQVSEVIRWNLHYTFNCFLLQTTSSR